MSRDTFADALDEMFGLLSSGGQTPAQTLLDVGVRKVYDYEPGPTGWHKPCSVTLEPAGIDPDNWVVRCRIYISDGQGRTPQDVMVAATVAVDEALKAGEGFGPSAWQMGWNGELGCYLSFSDVQIGRQDF